MSENEEQPVEENAEAQAEATPEQTAESAIDQEVIQAIPINLTIEVGSTTLKLRDLLKLSQGSIKVNNTVIAKGEVVETTEGKYGITVVEIVAPLDRIKPA